MPDIAVAIHDICQESVIELPRQNAAEAHYVIEDSNDLLNLCEWAAQQDYYFCTMVANDERLLEDHIFKLYYVLSAPDGKLVILEYPLSDRQYPRHYPSIRASFPAVVPLEQKACDMFGITPHQYPVERGFILHHSYPPNFCPLRPGRTPPKLQEMIGTTTMSEPPLARERPHRPEGLLLLPVGPIHAGIIEAGHFLFHVAGEVIEDLTLQLGYKHRGIEKLFQTKYPLVQGHELAEKVSGDSSFAHSMAYCQAVESLAGVAIPPPAMYWRGLLLEQERICNHIGDVGALVHDMAFDLLSSEIAVLRETLLRLNQRTVGHRLLRGVNCPGGVTIASNPDLTDLQRTVREVVERFLELGKTVMDVAACRDRTVTTGTLTREEARALGATGLVARASGLWQHDFRLRHPFGAYARTDLELQQEIRRTIVEQDDTPPSSIQRNIPVFLRDLQGDVYARMVLRIAEVETSARIIARLLKALRDCQDCGALTNRLSVSLERPLRSTANFESGLGYVEGWRGDIVYWVMKGARNSIFRCKLRDPSCFNWPALRQATIRKPDPRGRGYLENILADFPLINKSFNLSYAGHDL